MDQRAKIVHVLMISGVIMGGVCANQFVVQKKKTKTPSVNTLKEQCCSMHADILQTVPVMMHGLADLQTEACNTIHAYMESDKASFCNTASKETLLKYNSLIESVQKACDNFTTEITTLLHEIKSLKTR